MSYSKVPKTYNLLSKSGRAVLIEPAKQQVHPSPSSPCAKIHVILKICGRKHQWSRQPLINHLMRQPVIFRSPLPWSSFELLRSASKIIILRVKAISGRAATGVPFLPAHAWKSTMRLADVIYHVLTAIRSKVHPAEIPNEFHPAGSPSRSVRSVCKISVSS